LVFVPYLVLASVSHLCRFALLFSLRQRFRALSNFCVRVKGLAVEVGGFAVSAGSDASAMLGTVKLPE
jgi:hypothetical protein